MACPIIAFRFNDPEPFRKPQIYDTREIYENYKHIII